MESCIPDVISTIKQLALKGMDDGIDIKYLKGDTLFINKIVTD
jgi:hypothetical protein